MTVYSPIWDIVQQVLIENLQARTATSSAEIAQVAGQAETLETELNRRVERLLLVTEAMWELLSEKLGITVTDLAERVRTIDNRRHVAAETALLHCSACQAAIPPGKTTCQFCGAAVPQAKADPFRI